MMNIDEAIQYAENLGTEEENKIDYDKDSPHMIICRKNAVKDYRQLAEWLRELKDLREENKFLIGEFDRLINGELLKKSEQIAEYKRLLKAAVEDFRITSKQFEDGAGHCLSNGTCAECKLNGGNLADECQWIHEAEALKLIGDESSGI